MGRKREWPWVVVHDEREQTLNQILVEMDGFDSETEGCCFGEPAAQRTFGRTQLYSTDLNDLTDV